jgi:ornithine cyclodeaminase/alanine dehydrogenase-like protein (mu-crystallin family)
VGFVGLGNTARATLLCLDADQDRPLEVGLLAYKDQHEDFQKRFEGHANLSFRVFQSAQELCSWADVTFSCVTAADKDICGADTFRPGALVVPVHTRGFTQCDLVFDKVFCDDEAHVRGFGYYGQFKDRLAEMADVLEGRAAGRDDDSQRIIAYNIGISLHDIYYASKVYDLVGTGSADARLEKPTKKFWA